MIVKHANPCGVAIGKDALEAYSKAFQTDPTSAFGGIIAFNRPVDGAAAQAVAKQFVEVLMAPDFSAEALQVFAGKANVRLLKIALPPGGARDWDNGRNMMDVKRVGSGLLMQTADNRELALAELKVVTKKQPTPAGAAGPAVRLEGGQVREVQRDRVLQGRHDDGRGRGPDEPAGFGAHRQHQGASTPGCRCRARWWRATPSSRSATGSTWWWMRARPA